MSFKSLIRTYDSYFGGRHKRSHDVVHDKVNTYGTMTANGNCRRLRHDTEWWNIGGPDTILPRFIESFLCWSLALSCLSISGYHFIMDNYVTIVTASSQEILKRYIFNPLRLLYLGQCESPTKNTSISSSCSCNTGSRVPATNSLPTRRPLCAWIATLLRTTSTTSST